MALSNPENDTNLSYPAYIAKLTLYLKIASTSSNNIIEASGVLFIKVLMESSSNLFPDKFK